MNDVIISCVLNGVRATLRCFFGVLGRNRRQRRGGDGGMSLLPRFPRLYSSKALQYSVGRVPTCRPWDGVLRASQALTGLVPDFDGILRGRRAVLAHLLVFGPQSPLR